MNQIKQAAIRNERAARDELQRKNDLIVYLAHDIKTPLTSVIGYLSLLDEAPDMPPEQKAKYIGITLEKAYRLDQLIDEFFDITRFNLQHIEVNKAKINLSLMLRQMADEFYPMLTPHNKTAAVFVPGDLIVWGDADKLSRVFNNILKNAIAYSDDNATITINAFSQGPYTIITFANQGDAIPAEKLERIFEKFFRLDAARSSHTGGAGLGLAIAKEIVEAHGGRITAASSANQTVFTVMLPNPTGQAPRF
jgi:two-component system sensor histidine kinase VanS